MLNCSQVREEDESRTCFPAVPKVCRGVSLVAKALLHISLQLLRIQLLVLAPDHGRPVIVPGIHNDTIHSCILQRGQWSITEWATTVWSSIPCFKASPGSPGPTSHNMPMYCTKISQPHGKRGVGRHTGIDARTHCLCSYSASKTSRRQVPSILVLHRGAATSSCMLAWTPKLCYNKRLAWHAHLLPTSSTSGSSSPSSSRNCSSPSSCGTDCQWYTEVLAGRGIEQAPDVSQDQGAPGRLLHLPRLHPQLLYRPQTWSASAFSCPAYHLPLLPHHPDKPKEEAIKSIDVRHAKGFGMKQQNWNSEADRGLITKIAEPCYTLGPLQRLR